MGDAVSINDKTVLAGQALVAGWTVALCMVAKLHGVDLAYLLCGGAVACQLVAVAIEVRRA
jgi:hypothetical protein